MNDRLRLLHTPVLESRISTKELTKVVEEKLAEFHGHHQMTSTLVEVRVYRSQLYPGKEFNLENDHTLD